MITIEKLNEALYSMWIDSDLIYNPEDYRYSDVLEDHRCILWFFNLSFNIAELEESHSSTITLVYTWSNENNIVVFWIWLPEFKTLQDYLDWLNSNEEQALLVNK